MNNKERRRYRSLVSKKLLSMGIKDEITMKVSAHKPGLRLNPETKQIEQVMVPRYQAQNLHRALVREFTSKGPGVAEKFLALDANKFKGIKVEPPTEPPAEPAAENPYKQPTLDVLESIKS